MQGMTGTGTVRANRTEKTPLKVVEEMKKVLRGSHDVAVDAKSASFLTPLFDGKLIRLLQLHKRCMDDNQ